MKRIVVPFFFVLSLVLAACNAVPTTTPESASPASLATATQEAPAWPREFTDDLGRAVRLDQPPKAIVTLGASPLESLFAMGAGGLIVGRDDTSTFPEEALQITDIGSLFGELPSEAIVALEPDLILAPEVISLEQVTALEELGLTVYYQANPVDFDGLYANLLELGELTGHEEGAADLVASLEERVSQVEATLAEVENPPKVFYELDATDPQNPWTAGSGTFIDTVITMAKGINVGGVLEGDYAQISSEELLTQNPDVILLSDALYGVTPESVAARAGWDSITAVAENRIYPIDPFLLSVPGPRLVDGLEEVARLLHPGAGS
jgi:iron complex transport system substrate-binding protein